MKKEDFLKICRSKSKEPLTEQEESFFGTIGEAIESALTQDTVERNKKFDEITNTLETSTKMDGKSLVEIVRNLATMVDTIEAKTKRSFTGFDKSNLEKKLEENKDLIMRCAKDKSQNFEIQFRARRAAVMTTANVITGSQAVATDNYYEDPDLVVIQYPKNFILDAITSRQVSKVPATLIVREQQATSGQAVLTAEGDVKPLISFSVGKTYYTRDKYAGRIEYTEETEIDFEQLKLDIIAMFEEQVIRDWNVGVLSKITTYASSYVSSSLDGTVQFPDIYSVIMAGIAQMNSLNYEPDCICLNPADLWLAKSTQDENGNYKINPFTNGFNGLTLFTSTQVAVGKMLLGTKQTIKEQHGAFITRSGQYADQLIENEYTIIGEVFSVLQTPTVSKASWLYLDIDAVKQVLTLERA